MKKAHNVNESTAPDAAPSNIDLPQQRADLAHQLAAAHATAQQDAPRTALLPLLEALGQAAQNAHQTFADPPNEKIALSYAAEWMLDNYYVVRQALREIEKDLPERYYQQLPVLTDGTWQGYPRVYAIAHALLRESYNRVNLNQLPAFLSVYQQDTPLTMGELWALPIMLRFVTIEVLVQAMAQVIEMDLPPLQGALPDPFWQETEQDDIVANCIVTLRAMAVEDWKAFFEQTSLVHRTLAQDPAQAYLEMDFETRDMYRKAVETLGLASKRSELEVAERAVALAKQADTANARSGHVGYYLVDQGREKLESQLGYRPSGFQRVKRAVLDHPTTAYLGTIGVLSAAMIAAVLAYAMASGGSPGQVLLAGLLSAIPIITVATSLTNLIATSVFPPRILAKLDYEQGIPAAFRTMVVIPAMLTSDDEVDSLLTQIELHYLRNDDPMLTFALLTDFADAPAKTQDTDTALLEKAQAGILALNRRYERKGHDPFFLLHRERRWNPQEGVWMGWERKRGKLEEFNRLLAGENDTTYTTQVGDLEALGCVRFVITLDADTVLPRGAAKRLVGTLAHPLNRAQFDDTSNKLVSGYSILQPRTEVLPPAGQETAFGRIFAGDAGLDLYTHAVSDAYHDLFGEGIFVGKGIYDVAAFRRSLQDRVPENTLLSHDLFEGLCGRAALVTDVILYESYPPGYLAFAQRMHRWIRGDWQLLPWLASRVPTRNGNLVPTMFSAIDRWKLLDNLLRSLRTPLTLALMIAGWLWLPGATLIWTLLGLLVPAAPVLTSAMISLRQSISQGPTIEMWRTLKRQSLRWILALVFLPYESLIIADAIATTLVRVLLTQRRLLQWRTSSHTVRILGRQRQIVLVWQQMYLAPVAAVMIGALVAWLNLEAMPIAAPILLAWAASPYIAYWISQTTTSERPSLSEAEMRQLRGLARRTWLFFEQYVGPEDHWLPPDHFQESPRGLVAHRTSPTNIGLMLLCNISAYDLGYIDPLDLVIRTQNTFDTLERMAQHRGHWLNWYDTRTLDPLPPRYVSTVDSGNLAACLIALRQGLTEIQEQPLLRWARWQGLIDSVQVLDEQLRALRDVSFSPIEETIDCLQAVRDTIDQAQDNVNKWPTLLESLEEQGQSDLEACIVSFIDANQNNLSATDLHSLRIWSQRIGAHVSAMSRSIRMMAPWLFVPKHVLHVLADSTNPHLLELGQELGRLATAQPTIKNAVDTYQTIRSTLDQMTQTLKSIELSEETRQVLAWCQDFERAMNKAPVSPSLTGIITGCDSLAQRIDRYLERMEFGFLLEKQRKVFHIGYNVDAERSDDNYYDLLASEARIASLIAIAKGDISQQHWLFLGRPISQLDGRRAILSWNGSMFEYLMPRLIMRHPPETLLGQSILAAVDKQIAHGRQHQVPWGVSESGYYMFDGASNYQYRGFGVPGLGLKRGLDEDLVITPYASLLALSLRPRAVMENVQRLTDMGMCRNVGFYESIDYTQARLPLGKHKAVVRSYMAHHQGMILLSLANYMCDDLVVQRFHRDRRIQSAELLLQEQIPRHAPLEELGQEDGRITRPMQSSLAMSGWSAPLQSAYPHVNLISNGSYAVLLTNAGGGYSRWQETALTRWRADSTQDNWGNWVYLQDLDSERIWSLGQQPIRGRDVEREVHFYPHQADLRAVTTDLAAHMDITVAPDQDVEVRRILLTNQSDQTRHIRLTSYGEVVLNDQATDRRHPAFAKLFVESEFEPSVQTLLFHRRPRSDDENPIYMAHRLVVEPGQEPNLAYETDRAQFIGRGRSAANPAALDVSARQPGRTGTILDPILSMSQELELAPHSTSKLALITLVGPSREEAISTARAFGDWARIDRAFEQARVTKSREMRHLEMTSDEMANAQHLLSLLIYPHPILRAEPEILRRNTLGQPHLWPYSISGDHPILLVRVNEEEEIGLARELLQLHTYWRNHGLDIDLVLLDTQQVGYDRPIQVRLQRLVTRMKSDNWLNQPGGIFVLREKSMDENELVLLQSAARVILEADKGSLTQQLQRAAWRPTPLPQLTPVVQTQDNPPSTELGRPTDWAFDNGLGGFTADGREYQIYLEPGQHPPLPWANIIANEASGFLVTNGGMGYSWAENSGENRLTPWHNDPISELPGEALYLRDEETVSVWTPTPLPRPAEAPYLVRHGAGYTVFEHHSHGLAQQLDVFAPPQDPVKLMMLKLKNTWDRPRRITATYYAEWVLGVDRDTTQTYVIPEYDADCHAIMARNPYSADFGQRVAFAASGPAPHSLTADRAEFLGSLGNLYRPDALWRVGMSGNVSPGPDPCAAIQVHIDLEPGETKTVHWILGQGHDAGQARALAQKYLDLGHVEKAYAQTKDKWDGLLNVVQVDTPDPAMDILLNRWLLYQNLSCRFWGRSGFYQSSGAFGFRDQLQDVMALLHAAPEIARQHILRAARHQFQEGDVLHWWHPPSSVGVRTRISDDLLWLPYVTAEYVQATGDKAILESRAPFLVGDPLSKEEEERYARYDTTEETFTLYEHCQRAIQRGLTRGAHGLPLMQAGDWNDGMNRVGIQGQGESIWLGWFLYDLLTRFAAIAYERGKQEQGVHYEQEASRLQEALASEGWDGDWYRRAYYDDGYPLGSARNKACQIDSLAQSWAVLSDGGKPEQVAQAMDAVQKHLVRQDDGLLLLFTPPFDKTRRDPGYIKGYPPGIRENGGQYTHAAIWVVWALAKMGRVEEAESLFRMINPIYHSATSDQAARYKVEPYVMAADIYGVEPYVGRGGWTWYTGSGGWMYRLGLEAILGIQRHGNTLRIKPNIPADWPGYSVDYCFGQSIYHLHIRRTEGSIGNDVELTLDGDALPDETVPLRDDQKEHTVQVTLSNKGGE